MTAAEILLVFTLAKRGRRFNLIALAADEGARISYQKRNFPGVGRRSMTGHGRDEHSNRMHGNLAHRRPRLHRRLSR